MTARDLSRRPWAALNVAYLWPNRYVPPVRSSLRFWIAWWREP